MQKPRDSEKIQPPAAPGRGAEVFRALRVVSEDYYADVVKDGAAAVTWARADLQLRENFATQSALAWALYRNAEFAEARSWIDRALASGVADAHLLLRAAKIYGGADGRMFLERAQKLNPLVESFHLHH